MGNEHGTYGGGGYYFGGYGYGINRSGWKPVSDAAYKRLNSAKQEFHEFVKRYSFENIRSDIDYEFTVKHAIKDHLVGKLRPKFNKYAQKFGAKTKWVKLSETEKQSISKYKNRKSAIYFCNLTIDRNVKQNLMEQEPDAFKEELLITEISLFTKLKKLGVPEIDALGWILPIPNDQKIEKIPKINNLSQFIDEKMKQFTFIPIETTEEYKNDQNKKKKITKKVTKKTSSIIGSYPYKQNVNILNKARNDRNKANNISNSIRRMNKMNKKRKLLDLCSSDDDNDDDDDDDDEWFPKNKKRRLR